MGALYFLLVSSSFEFHHWDSNTSYSCNWILWSLKFRNDGLWKNNSGPDLVRSIRVFFYRQVSDFTIYVCFYGKKTIRNMVPRSSGGSWNSSKNKFILFGRIHRFITLISHWGQLRRALWADSYQLCLSNHTAMLGRGMSVVFDRSMILDSVKYYYAIVICELFIKGAVCCLWGTVTDLLNWLWVELLWLKSLNSVVRASSEITRLVGTHCIFMTFQNFSVYCRCRHHHHAVHDVQFLPKLQFFFPWATTNQKYQVFLLFRISQF